MVTLVMSLSGTAWAQGPPPVTSECSASLACLRQTVQDLRDYRQFVEDQLALAKSLLQAANQRIAQQQAQIKALAEPGEAPEKK